VSVRRPVGLCVLCVVLPFFYHVQLGLGNLVADIEGGT